jgi:hypothetical protein
MSSVTTSSRDAHTQVHRTPFAVRIRTRLERGGLDEQLVRGAGSGATAELSLRTRQLTSADGRRGLANALIEALGSARAPHLGPFRMKHRRRDEAIREAADDIHALVGRLRDDEPIDVRGAAMTARLLDDRSSPLHGDSAPALQDVLRDALAALSPRAEADRDLAAAA